MTGHREIVQFDEYGADTTWKADFGGLLKVRLVHGRGRSLLIPELLVLEGDDGVPMLYLLPKGFFPSAIARTDEDDLAVLFVDVANGCNVRVTFARSGFLRRLQDGSELFRCNVAGPAALRSHASGACRPTQDGKLLLRVFHHTTEESKAAILQSASLRGSAWNIAGTRRIASNCYAYLTSIPKIQSESDLRCIAMASSGKFLFWRDPGDPPARMPGDWRRVYEGQYVELTVYRESTANRVAALAFWAECDLFSPPHLLFRQQASQPRWFEICSPLILRIPLRIGRSLRITGFESERLLAADDDSVCRLGYVVIGDATSLDGLAAPFDEENTEFIFKAQPIGEGKTCLDFWFEHANRPLFDQIGVEEQRFE